MSLQISNLSKKYSLHHENGNRTLAETLSNLPRKWFFRRSHQKCEDFWALRDIDFEINRGDRVGIIGRNGAGKSTLLKIISKITPPTTGHIRTEGRVASLLEVGTGFHLELTGRENIFLNGAILGLKRKEIQNRFDEIVAFAEVEQFLDTPVKRFSSGMLARLGFAVAAHLDPDILIVDEVLAVGDKPFQDKCLKKLNEHGKNGRTVLFVSHNAGSILSLCQKGIFLEQGRLKMFGAIEDCLQQYLSSYAHTSKTWNGASGDEHLTLFKVSITGSDPGRDFFYQHETIALAIDLEIKKPHSDLFLAVSVWSKNNQLLASSRTYDNPNAALPKGRCTASFSIPLSLFHEGEYYLKIESGIYNVKTIAEIAIGLPVYCQSKNTRFESKAGVFLGHQWEFHDNG